ncbi:MAG: DUF763 domain-containing protein [Promethearchaeota archaeon]|jgi:hypothetical protein
MSKVGIATLPLHSFKAPGWLLKRMVILGKPIFRILYDMEGSDGILRRLSDTYWFQGLACILGFDWHSSGCTTVLGGVLKHIISAEEHGLIIAGGKGKASLKVKEHLKSKAKKLDYSDENIEELSDISRLVAKVDNAAIQDGFSLYHHLMLVSEKNWGIIQQGLDTHIRKARRYHWISEGLESYLDDPHSDINTEVYKDKVLNMASNESSDCRKVSMDLISEGSKSIRRYLTKLKDKNQTSLQDFMLNSDKNKLQKIPNLNMPIPFTLKWESVEMAKELTTNDYTELLKIQGIGPGMIRALALISEFVWGEPPSWKDPAKYSFAVGGKDGIPYPVNLKRMEKCAEILEEAIDLSYLKQNEKLNALKRLHKYKSISNNYFL